MGKNIGIVGVLISLCGCVHAQTRLSTPVIIQRKSTPTVAAGELVLPNSANINCIVANYATCKPLILQNSSINGANLAAALTITGATGTDGRIRLLPGNVSTLASVDIVSPSGNTTDPGLVIWDGGSVGATNGAQFKLANGTNFLKLDSATSGAATITAQNSKSLWVLSSPATTSISDAAFNFSSLSGYLMNVYSSGTGGMAVTSDVSAGLTGAWPGTANWQLQHSTGNADISGVLRFWNGTGFAGDTITVEPPPSGLTSWTLRLPPDDGNASDCLSTNGTGVTTWVACSAGSSPPFIDSTAIIKGSVDATKLLALEVDGLTTATTRTWTIPDFDMVPAATNHTQTFSANQTMGADLLADADTRKLGDATAFYQVRANRIEGMCSGCSATTNYASTRKLLLFDQGGTSDVSWDLMATYSGVNSWAEFRDNAGVSALRLQRLSFIGDANVAIFDLNLMRPSGTNRNIGSVSIPWTYGYFTDARVASAAGAGTRPLCADADGDLTVSGCSAGSGADTALSNLTSPTSINQDLLPSSGARSIGATANRWFNVWGDTVTGNQVVVGNNSGLGQRCNESDNTGEIGVAATPCIPNTRSISTSSPLSGGGNLTADRTISIQVATSGQNGYLSSTDWSTFNGKAPTASPTFTGTLSAATISASANISSSGGYINGTEVRVAGNVVINSSGILSNAFGVNVNAGIAGTGFNIYGGASGHTGSTCSAWTGGICTAP